MGAGGAIFVTSGLLQLTNVTLTGNSATGGTGGDNGKGLGGAIFIFNKADNGGQAAPGTTNDPSVSACGLTFSNNMASDQGNVSGSNDNNQYGPIAITNFIGTINRQPASSSLVCAGATVTASVSVTGTVQSYQWYRNGALVSGQTSATLTLTNVQTTNNGSYSVVVTGACNSVTSTAFSLTVNPIPSVSITPSATAICTGQSATLQATPGLASYRWSSGQITASISATATGAYTVTATNASSCSATASASVTVNAPPSAAFSGLSSPYCADAGAVTLVPATPGGQFSGPGVAGTTFTPANAGTGGTVSYSLTVSGCTNASSQSVTVNPLPAAPSLSNASRTLYASSTPLSLTAFVLPAPNPLRFTGVNGLIDPPTADISLAGVQNFSVSQVNANSCVSVATPFSLTILPTAPASQTVCRSSPVVLVAGAFGSRYEWYKNGTSAPFKLVEIASIQKGTAASSLTLVSVQTTANYYCKVFQADGSFVFTGPFAVVVNFGCVAPGARQAAEEPLATDTWQLLASPNPLEGDYVKAVIRGAEGRALRVSLLDSRGRLVRSEQWKTAESEQVINWNVSQEPGGVYVLQAVAEGTPTGPVQQRSLKVIKP